MEPVPDRWIYSALLKLLFDLGKVARFYVINEAEYKISFCQWLVWNKPSILWCCPAKRGRERWHGAKYASSKLEHSLGPSLKTAPSAQPEAYSNEIREDLADDDEYAYSDDDDSSDGML